MDGSRSVGEVTGAILAGGRARRFDGRLKATLRIQGERLVDRQLAVLRTVSSSQLIVTTRQAVTTPGVTPEAGPYDGLGVEVVTDLVEGAGPLGGLLTALHHAAGDRVIVLAGDMPFVSAPFLRFLLTHAPDAEVVVPRTSDGLHPLCAVYRVSVLPVVRDQIHRGDLALHALVARTRSATIEPVAVAAFDSDGRLLMNVNTPADYERSLRR
jgi:molybdopterin-guanine dinucleotide biosynthesis protein A